MSDLASSNGRTPNFDFGNSGSTPLARTTPTAHAKKLRALVPACDDPADYTSDDRVMLEAADAIEAAEARALAAEWKRDLLLARMEELLTEAEDVFVCMADATGIDRHNYPPAFMRARAALTHTGE